MKSDTCLVLRDAFFAPLEHIQLLVLHCKAGAVPRSFSLCRFITTGRWDAHSNQRFTNRFTINFDVEEFMTRKHMSGVVNLHHHIYPHIDSRIIPEVYHFGTHHSEKVTPTYSTMTRCSQMGRLRMLPCLPTYSFSDFVWRKKIWLVVTQI